MAKAKEAAASTEVATTDDVDELVLVNKVAQGIDFVPESWDDIASAFNGEVLVFEGSPWKITNKADLVGVPFMIADVRAYVGSFGNEVVAVMALIQGPQEGTFNRIVFNDGSTGVKDQVMHMVKSSGRKSGIMCEGGLRASKYDYEPTDLDGNSLVGKPKPEGGVYEITPAVTYYVA